MIIKIKKQIAKSRGLHSLQSHSLLGINESPIPIYRNDLSFCLVKSRGVTWHKNLLVFSAQILKCTNIRYTTLHLVKNVIAKSLCSKLFLRMQQNKLK